MLVQTPTMLVLIAGDPKLQTISPQLAMVILHFHHCKITDGHFYLYKTTAQNTGMCPMPTQDPYEYTNGRFLKIRNVEKLKQVNHKIPRYEYETHGAPNVIPNIM